MNRPFSITLRFCIAYGNVHDKLLKEEEEDSLEEARKIEVASNDITPDYTVKHRRMSLCQSKSKACSAFR